MVERRFCTPEVRSSILLGSTNIKISPTSVEGYFYVCGTRTESDLRHFRENRMRVGKLYRRVYEEKFRDRLTNTY